MSGHGCLPQLISRTGGAGFQSRLCGDLNQPCTHPLPASFLLPSSPLSHAIEPWSELRSQAQWRSCLQTPADIHFLFLVSANTITAPPSPQGCLRSFPFYCCPIKSYSNQSALPPESTQCSLCMGSGAWCLTCEQPTRGYSPPFSALYNPFLHRK